MRAPDLPISLMAIALSLSLATAALAPGCSPGASGSGASNTADSIDTLELECERGLEALDAAIARAGADTMVAAATLLEARALRDTAGELYIEAEFELALEFIDEALALLGRT